MKRNDEFTENEFTKRTDQTAELEMLDPKLREALGNFKANVHAWSEAMMSRPQTLREVVVRRTWKLAAGWALGCVLVVGGVSTGLYEHHHQRELARIAEIREAEHQRLVAAEHTREEEDFMAKVDSDVSREVPSAMEPLASLMTYDEAQ